MATLLAQKALPLRLGVTMVNLTAWKRQPGRLGFMGRSNPHVRKEWSNCTFVVIPNPLYPGVRDLYGTAGVKKTLREYAQDDIVAGIHDSTVQPDAMGCLLCEQELRT